MSSFTRTLDAVAPTQLWSQAAHAAIGVWVHGGEKNLFKNVSIKRQVRNIWRGEKHSENVGTLQHKLSWRASELDPSASNGELSTQCCIQGPG